MPIQIESPERRHPLRTYASGGVRAPSVLTRDHAVAWLRISWIGRLPDEGAAVFLLPG